MVDSNEVASEETNSEEVSAHAADMKWYIAKALTGQEGKVQKLLGSVLLTIS